MSRCGARLHFETLRGTRLYVTVRGKRVYRWRCPSCGASGTSDGRRLRCRERKP